MGGKRRRLAQKEQANAKRFQKGQPGQGRAAASDAKAGQPKSKKGPNPAHQQKQHEKPTIPFNPEDRILLIGEGDLSFAASLATHHRCMNLVATVLEKHHYKEQDRLRRRRNQAPPLLGLAPSPHPHPLQLPPRRRQVHRRQPPGPPQPVPPRLLLRPRPPRPRPGGTIVVTLFEGEPYTLWNVRDLARHAGLQVDRSFRFQASAYPGYRHARTLGVVKARSGEEGGGWKGEERAARSYVFVRKGDTPLPFGASRVNTSKKRRRGQDEDDSDEDF
ncbi:hypothetical protein V2G26_020851 [Clonostachys chloroleuca]